MPMRKKLRKEPYHQRSLLYSIIIVKWLKTAGSLIEQLFPKSIHAVTSQGFALKVALFVIASSLNCYLNL